MMRWLNAASQSRSSWNLQNWTATGDTALNCSTVLSLANDLLECAKRIGLILSRRSYLVSGQLPQRSP